MFRVFIELSLDDFGKRKKIHFRKPVPPKAGVKSPATGVAKTKEMTLREKIKTGSDYLESAGICSKAELQGAGTMAFSSNHILSIVSLNAYVHNKDYSPTPSDLKANWDSIQTFVEYSWTS